MSLIPPLPPLYRRSLGDQVYTMIRESIVYLRMEPGSMIYENELTVALKVSRTPIREAIRLLVSEQLLEVLPQRGTRISQISERKVGEVRFIREQLETGAFRMAARLWKDADRKQTKQLLLDLMDKQQAAAEIKDVALFLQLDEAFHHTIMEVTGNETLLQVINHMRAHLNRLRYLALKEFHSLDRIVEEHRALLAAIEQGDEGLAVAKLGQHINKLDQELPELRSLYPHYFIP